MSRKRRMFDIDLPKDDVAAPPDAALETFPAGKADQRRGPMATAIVETAESQRDRARIEAGIRAENDALAQEHVRLKRAGLIVDLVPLDAVDTRKLIRDRTPAPDPELGELVASIRDIGLSNPIRVEPGEDGRYELIQGWRRLAAYRQLLEETGDAERWGRIPAGIVARGDALESLYRRMVDENLVRKDLSFAEMAQMALHYAMDPETGETDPEKAVAVLFKSAGYQKRSYIRAFIPVVERLEGVLLYPHEIPRALGLALAQRLEEVPGLVAMIRAELAGWDTRSVRDELEVLRRHAGQGDGTEDTGAKPRPSQVPVPAGRARTSFQIARPQGSARCTATNGRLEIRLPRDFSTIDRRKLEAAVAEMLGRLD
ncbi:MULTISPECIES: ParB N-terminal domain-containing protein [unclassified Paracoccus (in: a-proteobacteria)]|uniref:ParB/RepB/Spo0J family partition protein n=1 Tax=unclassified Paracoccus (in: a-proteobacteria) TaxID=2688777 RepID=UPI001601AADF|nr:MULTISPECIES: ParB N-terminal domain-containing protein [unclassified Paracoccus (in: a-proteobacteria)]MBB1492331.1 ParB N-terminal domain-containing protein [Paracoccus sp. MC1854]MBB1498410.1 ParB N-terminal domain-containing protein [Paracoccus sp. MC1862]QQO46673.1 ParB N-terminal domain-containing protein [Paracoccus sp. MC1862]